MASFTQDTETETAIFQAALRVFARKGKDGARMQEIADEADINKSMLHYYYRSKDGLYESVFTQVMGHFMSTVEQEIDDERPFRAVLKGIIDAYIDEHRMHPEVVRIWTHENLNGAPIARKVLSEQVARGHETTPVRFARRIRRAVKEGEIREVDPIHTVLSVLGASIFFFLAMPTFSVVKPEIAGNLSESAERRKENVFDLVYHGLQPR